LNKKRKIQITLEEEMELKNEESGDFMVEKIRPIASIQHSYGNDGRDGFDYIQYNCPKCKKRILDIDIACDNCGTFFNWEKMAKIKTIKTIIWE
jgi:hypothetical protein